MDQMVFETQIWLNMVYSNKEGFTPFTNDELDGITGNGTFKRLIQALQIELNERYKAGLTVDGDFGKGTLNAMPSEIEQVSDPTKVGTDNMHYIIQGSLWCKGYSAGGFDGVFGPSTAEGVKSFQRDAGITQDGIIRPYIMQGLMNTDSYKLDTSISSYENPEEKSAVQKSLNADYGPIVGLIPPNGNWERKSHTALIKACQTAWHVSGVDGLWGPGTMSAAPLLSTGSTDTENIKLLQWSLIVNGYLVTVTKQYDEQTRQAVYNFQEFLCLGADGIAGQNTWASLLATCGNTSRSVTAFDTATRLTDAVAAKLVTAGYNTVGRYLTNVEGTTLDKKITIAEIEVMKKYGMKVFPIYQTYGNYASYFDYAQGMSDAKDAFETASYLGFPAGTTIYFSVDFDVLVADIESKIIPYFKGINESMAPIPAELLPYKIGAYGPRRVCNVLYREGLINTSFVADMSSGFTCNIGQKMPENWAFEQIYEIKLPNTLGIAIDKVIVSPRETAVLASELDPEKGYCGGDDYKNPAQHRLEFHEDGYYVCKDCGYRFPHPSLQDKAVLDKDDYMMVTALTVIYSTMLSNTVYNNHYYDVWYRIHEIRTKDKYDNKYDYVGTDGKCLYIPPENETTGAPVGNFFFEPEEVTDANIAEYNGTLDKILETGADIIFGIAYPASLAESILMIISDAMYEHEIDITNFNELLVVIAEYAAEKSPDYAGLSVWATVLKAIQLGVEVTDIEGEAKKVAVGDYVVTYQLNMINEASYITRFEVVFDSDGNFKTLLQAEKEE